MFCNDNILRILKLQFDTILNKSKKTEGKFGIALLFMVIVKLLNWHEINNVFM